MDPESLLPQVLFLFGIGFFVANVKVIVGPAAVPRSQGVGAACLAEPEAALLRLHAGARRHPRRARRLQDLRPRPTTEPAVRRGHDVRVLRLRVPAQHAHRPRASTATASGRTAASCGGARSRPSPGRRTGAVTLVLISHFRSIARRLEVPGHLYGAGPPVARDRIKAHDIHIGGAGLDLGSRARPMRSDVLRHWLESGAHESRLWAPSI